MSVWAIILYVIEGISLLGVFAGVKNMTKGPIKSSIGTCFFALATVMLAVYSITALTKQSAADHAEALGFIYFVLTVIWLPDFFRIMLRGEFQYTMRRAVPATISSLVGIVLTSVMAFAG